MKKFIYHRHRYWTEYLDFLLEDDQNFDIVCSEFSSDRFYKGKNLELFDCRKHKQIVSSGIIDDRTKNNSICFRSQHSPGFYVVDHIIAYRGFCQYHKDSQFTMSLLASHYGALLTRELDHPELDKIRYQMLSDQRVYQVQVDLSLYQFLNRPVVSQRKAGFALICTRWLLMYVDISEILKMMRFLKKYVRLSLVIHPCTSSLKFIETMQSLKGEILDEVYLNVPREKMLDLYDTHEFIVSDGSGSCYEAMLRGCKPLKFSVFKKGCNDPLAAQLQYDQLDEEYFPFPDYREIMHDPKIEYETFLKKYFPFLYKTSFEEAKKIAKQEVLSTFEVNSV